MVLPVLPCPASAADLDVPRRAAYATSGPGSAGDVPALPGVMKPSKQVTVSSPLEGMLMSLLVREGQQVGAGEILAVMDNRVSLASLNLARAAADRKADLQHAREELKLAADLLQRLQALKTANGGSEFELLEAVTRVEQARAMVAREEEAQRHAQCQLELEETRLETHNLRAPFAGQVVQVHAHAGSTLTRDDDLLTILHLDELEAQLHLPLTLYHQLEPGRDYTLLAGSPVNKPIQARLSFVAPTIDAATHTFRVVFTFRNQDQQLPAGFSVQLDTEHLRGVLPAASTSRN
jgi:cobalt-zinc-cadmium efflux system membrane fusion protein